MSRADAEERSVVLLSREQQARNRRRRQTYTFLGLFIFVALIGLIALASSMQWLFFGGDTAVAVACPTQVVSLPSDTKVNVYNATTRSGLAAAVAGELQKRDFQVKEIGTETPAKPVKSVVMIRYGVSGKVYAHTVALQFPGRAKLVKDRRTSQTVDLVIGTKYQQMVGRSKAAEAIAMKPQPDGCVVPTTAAVTPSISAS